MSVLIYMIFIYFFHPGSITTWSPAGHFGRKPSSCRLSLCLRRNWVICRRSSAMKFKAMCSPLTSVKIQLILDHAFGKIYFFSCYVSLHVTVLWWRILWIINTYKYRCFIIQELHDVGWEHYEPQRAGFVWKIYEEAILLINTKHEKTACMAMTEHWTACW